MIPDFDDFFCIKVFVMLRSVALFDVVLVLWLVISAVKSIQLEYLVKSTSNWPKSYSVTK